MDRKICRHCSYKPANRPRQLCFVCYNLQGVREQYEPIGQSGRFGAARFASRHPPLPKHPTLARAGSPEKMAVMEQRAQRGEQLFHPDDNPEQIPYDGHRGRLGNEGRPHGRLLGLHRRPSRTWLSEMAGNYHDDD